MTTDAPTFSKTLVTILAENDVRRVTTDDDGYVAVVVGVYYDNAMAGHFTARTRSLFTRIGDALGHYGLSHHDSEMDDYVGDDFDAVEVWIFSR